MLKLPVRINNELQHSQERTANTPRASAAPYLSLPISCLCLLQVTKFVLCIAYFLYAFVTLYFSTLNKTSPINYVFVFDANFSQTRCEMDTNKKHVSALKHKKFVHVSKALFCSQNALVSRYLEGIRLHNFSFKDYHWSKL